MRAVGLAVTVGGIGITNMDSRVGEQVVGRIPIKNLWLLMLYASDLTRFRGTFEMLADSEVNDLPDLVANLLSTAVERRMKRLGLKPAIGWPVVR